VDECMDGWVVGRQGGWWVVGCICGGGVWVTVSMYGVQCGCECFGYAKKIVENNVHSDRLKTHNGTSIFGLTNADKRVPGFRGAPRAVALADLPLGLGHPR